MMDSNDIKNAIKEALEESDTPLIVVKPEHYRFVEEMIERRRIREERNERIRQQVIGWGVITFLSGVGYGSYHLLVEFAKKVSH